MTDPNDKNQQMAEYILTFTQKLSKTFKQLNDMTQQFLKTLNNNQNQYSLRNKNSKDKSKDKDKLKIKHDDLNSNLLNQDDQQLPPQTLNPQKKPKSKNRILQAQEDPIIENQSLQKVSKGNSIKKVQENHSKIQLQTKSPDKKKNSKPINHKPKAPTSSFLLFFKQQQQSIAKSYPNYSVVELTKVAAKCWNDLPAEDKEPYQKLFDIGRKKYQQEMQKYRRDFPEQVRMKEMEKKQKKKNKAKERREKGSATVKKVTGKQSKPASKLAQINNTRLITKKTANTVTPSGVKLEQRSELNNKEKIEQRFEDQIGNYGHDQMEQEMEDIQDIDEQEEENSLGEDI